MVLAIFFCGNLLFAQEEDLTIGNVTIPRDFIHAGQDYSRGVYHVVLSYQDGVPVFLVHDKNKELLFTEMAAIKPNKNIKVRNYRIRREMLKNNEFFRIMVIKPEKLVNAFFLIKK